MIGLYNFFMIGAIAAAFPVLAPYLLLSEKRRKTFLARLGIASPPLSRLKTGAGPGPDDRTQDLRIWVHALSVGEVLSAAPLVKALADRPNQRVFFFRIHPYRLSDRIRRCFQICRRSALFPL